MYSKRTKLNLVNEPEDPVNEPEDQVNEKEEVFDIIDIIDTDTIIKENVLASVSKETH